MSAVFKDHDVEYVNFVLNKKDGSGTTTFAVGIEYYPADVIFTGSPIVYPVLVETPTVKRGVGRDLGIRFDVTIAVLGKADFDEIGKGFLDLKADYEFQGSEVELRYYSKAAEAVTTSSSVNLRQVCEIIDVSYEDATGVMSIVARDTWFKDRIISKRFNSANFGNLDTEWDGEIQPIYFGDSSTTDGVISLAPIVDYDDATGTDGHQATAKIFTGRTTSGHPNKSLQSVWVRNRDKTFVPDEWVKTELVADPDVAWRGDAVNGTFGGSYFLNAAQAAIVHSPPTDFLVATHVRVRLIATSDTDSEGILRIAAYHAVFQPQFDAFQPHGAPISIGIMDISQVTPLSADTFWVTLDPFIVMSPDRNYMFAIEYTGASDSDPPKILFENESGAVHYSRLDDGAFVRWDDERLGMEIYVLGEGASFDDGTTGVTYSSQLVATADALDNSGTHTYTPGDTTITQLDFAVGMYGIEDNGAGNFTGTANSQLHNPADVIKFILQDSDFGLGIDGGDIDTTQFDAVRGSLDTAGIDLSFVLDYEITAGELIGRICRQARIVFYKGKDGKLTVSYPEPLDNNSLDSVLSEERLRADMSIVNYDDNDYSTVTNDFRQLFKPDPLNTPKDASFLRKAGTDKFDGYQELHADGSTGDDVIREGKAAASEVLYEKRPVTEPADLLHDADAVKTVQKYRFDRSHELQRRAFIRLLRRDYNARDFFDTVRIEHTAIPQSYGTMQRVHEHNDGAEITPSVDGVPLSPWAGGTIIGEVVELEEGGPFITLTVETMSSFEAS